MPISAQQKLAILSEYPQVLAVYTKRKQGTERLFLLVDDTNPLPAHALPTRMHGLPVEVQAHPPITDMLLRGAPQPATCYNEPIPAGVQIQPAGAAWVGTYGAPCNWQHHRHHRQWGILSNWHVLVRPKGAQGDPICQPTEDFRPFAWLDDWEEVDPEDTNLFDAAIADAYCPPYHSIDNQIKCLGRISPDFLDPTEGDRVAKCGRTSGLTKGVCQATDAAVRVSYGEFTADFINQAIFTPTNRPFSQPGDSGSLIVKTGTLNPTALLFAGNALLTVGSPITPIANRFNLSFHFPED